MDKLIIKGNADLRGGISIKGSKNSALPIMVSALLSEKTLKLKNIPKLDDIKNMSKLLLSYGSVIKSSKDNLEINTIKTFNAGCNIALHCNGNLKEMQIVGKNSPLINKFVSKKTSQFYKILS